MLDSTKQNVVNSLLTLLDEKPMDDITISELTQMAGISRMTFYRNYSCKEDILSEHFKDVLKQYKLDMGDELGKGNYYDKKNIIHCFQYFFEQREFLESVMKRGFNYIFLSEVDKNVMKIWWKRGDGQKKAYCLHAFAGALYNLYISWAVNGYKETPEEMAELLEAMRLAR